MGGNSFGKIFRISTFGESHGVALGVIVDGCPAGLPLSEEDIQRYLERRRPGKNLKMTARKEGDRVEILSGVFEGYSTGTAIALLVRNEDQSASDRGMPTMDFSVNTGFGITAEEGVLPVGKPFPE